MAKKSVRRKAAKKAAKKKSPSPPRRSISRQTRPKEPSWVKALRMRKEPLSLAIEENGEIAFWKYSFNGPHDYNLMAWHPEGDLDFGFDEPSRREHYRLDTPAFRRLGYRTKRARIIDLLEENGADLGDVVPWQDTEQGLNEWLDSPPSLPCESELSLSGFAISEWDNQYRPGHPIHDALTPGERKLLGIIQGDSAGPGSDGCMLVTVECTLDDLNEIIRQKKLPFVVVEDKRFRKPTLSVLAKK